MVTKKRKIMVLGARAVGKSSLVKRFVENEFQQAYAPTIRREFTRSLTLDGIDYSCSLVDNEGHDEYTPIEAHHIIGIHGYVLVYSIAKHSTLGIVNEIYQKLLNAHGVPHLPCVIVGSMLDLQYSNLGPGRQVNRREGEDLAQSLNCGFTETSSRDNTNVERAFELCIREIEKTTAQYNIPPASNSWTRWCTAM